MKRIGLFVSLSLCSLVCSQSFAVSVTVRYPMYPQTYYKSMIGGVITLKNGDVSYVSTKVSSKTGKACGYNILNFVSWGNASGFQAATNGNIQNITSVDSQTESYIVYGKTCTVVTGE